MTAGLRRTERVARVVAYAAFVWFAFASVWGMFGIPEAGHIGAGSAGNVMAAEQMIKWKIGYPAWGWFNPSPPPPTDYICHHPFGQYYIPAVLYWLFGHRDFIVHLPAVLMSAAMPPLLYGIAKERWGVTIGAVAAAAYTVVPIAVGFANFWNLETLCIFGALLYFWGHTRHMATQKRRYMVASLAGLVFAVSGDWAGYMIVAPVFGWTFLRAFILPDRLTPRFRLAPYAQWWALSIVVVIASLVWWVGLFQHAKMLNDWLNAGTLRGSGSDIPLSAVLEGRKAWIEFSFTPVAIAIGKIAAPITVLRLLALRNDEEAYAPSLLFGAIVQYVAFKEGADVHIFWPHYFAPYFALALAQLAASLAAVAGWIARRFRRGRAAAPLVAAVTGLAVGLAPVVAMADDGVKSLWVWRRTGGRYDDSGTFIRSQSDFLDVLKQVLRPVAKRGERLTVHPSCGWGWEQAWTYQEPDAVVSNLAMGPIEAGRSPYWVARADGLNADEQKKIASMAHVRVYGDVWVVDRREKPAPLDAYSMNEHEPNFFQWLFDRGTDPERTIGTTPDPWLTWEWRVHLEQPADPPTGEPKTLDEIRIAHNAAIERGDAAAAETWREKIEAELDRTVETRFTRGFRLIGARVTGGVEPAVESWFAIEDAPHLDVWFDIKSRVEKRAPFSTIPAPATVRQTSHSPLIATKAWRSKFIYRLRSPLNHRIGVERYYGMWERRGSDPAPERVDKKGDTTLAVVR